MDNRKDLDTSLSGLTQEKMQKVSAFRVTANVTLAKSSLPAMTVGQAVKYLYASKFDVKKAEEIFHRYQELHKEFSLSDLTLNKHSLNTEIRSKKLEILGARDNDGAQILLFTVKKHKGGGGGGGGGGVSPENKTAVQLLFLFLDQISESNGTMNKGVTLLVDLQECSQSICDMKYVTTILNVLHGGYPLYLNMVYILEAPSWFKLSREPVYQSLTKAGKVKMLSLIDLSSVISPSSLPSSLKFPLKPHSPPSSSSSSPNHVTSRNKSPPKSNPPMAPPPRMDKPMKKQSSEPTIPLQGEELDAMSSVSVSKIMEVFQGQVPTSPPPPPHAVKSQALSRGGKLPQANGTGGAQNHHGNQKNSKLFGGSSGPPLQPPKTSSAPPQYEVVGGGSPPSSSPVRKVSPPSKYPPLFPPPSSIPPPSYSPPPPPPSSSKPTKPSVSQRPHWLHKSPKVSDTEATPTQTSYSAEDVGNVHEEEGEGTGGGAAVPPKSRDDSDISTTSSGASSSNKQKSSPSVSKRLRLGEAGNKIAQVFKGKKGAESDKKQATPSQDEDAPGSDAVGDSANKKLEKIGKSLVPVKIFGHKKENNDKDQSDSVKSNGHASNHAPSTVPKGNRSHLMQYNNVSVKPTRPLEKIVTDRDPSHTSATPTQPYMVTKIREKLPMSPPAAWTPPEYAAIRKPIKPDHASPRRSLTPPPSLPPQYSEDALLDDEDDDNGVGGALPHQHKRVDKRNAYENICFTVDEDEGEILSSESAKADEIIYENYGPDKGNRWMTTSELEQYITEKGNKGLSEEYLKIKNEPVTGSADYFRLPCNSNKNRYKDVICYDSTRVSLSSIPDVEGSDYIHANYCNGYQKPQAVILTQGPLKRTVNDYWRMLWEKEVFVIVMATKCIEMRKLKCAQYWPDGTTSTVSQFGDITVTVVSDVSEGTYQFRQFVAIKNGETRNLMHYQFLGWPDYGVPENGSDVIDVLYAARTMQESYRDYVINPDRFPVHGPPMVIHCSAGIGRSGTFASLDYCIDELRMTNKVNVQQCVRLLRQQRAFSIQTDEQYAFCYKTVLQYALYLKAALER